MRRILATTGTLLTFLATAPKAFAQVTVNPCPDEGPFAAACRFSADSFDSMVGGLITAVFVIAVIVALGYLIYGAIRWIISSGDKSKVTDARNHIIASIIGLVIVFLSYFIINLILGLFFGTNLQGLSLPSKIFE